MGLIKLRLSMFGTLAFIIGASTLFLTIILSWMGALNIITLLIFVVGFNIVQWLFAPRLIEAMYGVKEASESNYPRLHFIVRRICQKAGMAAPRLMIARMSIPNAFAYGSPTSGSRLAVTKGLLDTLEEEEVEAVVGHELGHLKHRDVQIMMFASVLPAIFYYIGYWLMLSTLFGGGRQRGGGVGYMIAIGFASMAIYWLLSILVLGLSRLREYYADQYSVHYVEDGARKLSEALAKIVTNTSRVKRQQGSTGSINSFRALFISDPEKADRDMTMIGHTRRLKSDRQLVQEILSKKVATFDRVMELFSTHPNIVKRLKALRA